MIRHRRYASLDSSSLLGLVPVRHAFTLQQSSNGPRTARLTAHTSPLALAPAISTPCSPQSDSETEMEEQLERMVSSVVNSPTTPSSAGFPSASQLGLGLPSTMQGQHRRALSSTSVGRSLLPARPSVEGDPKLNMGMRAAVGNYRKRVLTGIGLGLCLLQERAYRGVNSSNYSAAARGYDFDCLADYGRDSALAGWISERFIRHIASVRHFVLLVQPAHATGQPRCFRSSHCIEESWSQARRISWSSALFGPDSPVVGAEERLLHARRSQTTR